MNKEICDLDANGKIYLFHDFPLSYISERNGRKFFVHFYDSEKGLDGKYLWEQWLVREATDAQIEEFEQHRIDIRSFLLAGEPLYYATYDNVTQELTYTHAIGPENVLPWMPEAGVYVTSRPGDADMQPGDVC